MLKHSVSAPRSTGKSKRLLLFKEILKDAGVVDGDLFKEMCSGFTLSEHADSRGEKTVDSLQIAIPTSMLYPAGSPQEPRGTFCHLEFTTKLSNVLESDNPPSTILEDSQPEQRCDEIEQKFNCADSQLL